MVVSDLEAMLGMLERAGLSHVQKEPNPDYPKSLRPGTVTEITVEDMGYPGFFSVLGFDEDGRLLSVGSWE